MDGQRKKRHCHHHHAAALRLMNKKCDLFGVVMTSPNDGSAILTVFDLRVTLALAAIDIEFLLSSVKRERENSGARYTSERHVRDGRRMERG